MTLFTVGIVQLILRLVNSDLQPYAQLPGYHAPVVLPAATGAPRLPRVVAQVAVRAKANDIDLCAIIVTVVVGYGQRAVGAVVRLTWHPALHAARHTTPVACGFDTGGDSGPIVRVKRGVSHMT